MADRTVSVRLRMLVTEYVDGARKAKQETASLLTEIEGLRKKSPQAYDDIAMAIGGVGLALTATAGYAVMMGMQFDKGMSAVKAATDAGAADMEKLRQAALDAGAATAYSATEAAKAETELAKAGVKAADILGGGLRGALDLAAAGQMDVGEAAETAATAMVQFGLSGRDLPHVADLLAAGAGKAQGEVHDLGMALKQSGLVANQFGISVEETTGALAAFASAGMIGSDAGTSLKTMLLMLANPSKESAATMRELGINAYDASGKFVGLKDLAGQLQRQMSGLTAEQRDQALATIFGSDAVRAANVLYRQGSDGIAQWTDSVNEAGAASDSARTKTDNLAGDLEKLKGSIETLAIGSGSGAAGGLRVLVQAATGIVNGFAAIPGPVSSAMVAIAGISGVALLATAGMMKLRQTTADALAGLTAAGPAGASFASGVDKTIGVVGKLTATLAALQIASAAIGSSATPQMTKFSKELVEFGKSGKQGSEVAKLFGDDLENLKYDLGTLDTGTFTDIGNGFAGFVEGVTGMGSTMDLSLQHAKERLTAIDTALTQLATSGKSDQAAAAFERLKKVASEQGISLNELLKGLPQYAAYLDGAATSSDRAGAAAAAHKAQLDLMNMGLAEATKKAGGFQQAFDSLNGTLFGTLDAEMAAETALDNLSTALSKNGNEWNIDTAAGRENTQALEQAILKARDAAQAKYAEGASVDQVNNTYQGYLQRMRDAAGGNAALRAQVEALITKYGQIPPVVSTTVTAPGLGSALDNANSLDWRLRNMLRRVNIEVNIAQKTTSFGGSAHSGVGYSTGERWGGAIEHAAVGALRDPAIYRTGARPLYGFAEPETGGEAFIPRFGDLARSRAIVEHVASRWLGGTVAWGGQGGGSVVIAPTVQVYAGIGADAAAIGTRARAAIIDVVDAYNRGNVRR